MRQNFELSDQEANSLVGAGLILGSTALGARDNVKFANNLKTKHHNQLHARHQADNSISFKKSLDDTSACLKSKDYGVDGSKPSAVKDYNHSSGEVISGELVVYEKHPSDVTAHLSHKKSLASQEQISELYAGKYTIIAGAGYRKIVDDAPRLVAQYGGEIKDWVKITSNSYTSNKAQISIHAYKNNKTGEIFEMKTKLD